MFINSAKGANNGEARQLSAVTANPVKAEWLRGQDLNLLPSGYEPDELPDCSTPQQPCYLFHVADATGAGWAAPADPVASAPRMDCRL